jgi:hypothetical protein
MRQRRNSKALAEYLVGLQVRNDEANSSQFLDEWGVLQSRYDDWDNIGV